ncbi:N-acetylglucosamine-6-phosphate deacetylase [Microbacterium gorillae]|uniref:N-acetylglucosamine-6-phosphate deacetylase n=1 Tax=Microbacterium gorillae TaxID=1231063 RepID=UPI003D96B18C
MRTLIHSVDIIESGQRLPGAWALLDEDGILATGQTTPWQDVTTEADVVIDAIEVAGEGALLTPGFIDVHGHGGAGHAYDDGVEAIRAARAVHRAHGTTRAVISLVTATIDDLAANVARIADLTRTDRDILGSHLEGPFLDPGHKGAHDSELLRDPEVDLVQRLLDAGEGTVRQVTLAPELSGGLDAVRAVVTSGAIAAVGHTDADADIAGEAFDAGATLITHAFNAMPGIHHRKPGPVVAAASDPRVRLEIIADGTHVDLDLIRMMFASAPGRIVLVTDAMAAAGVGDGDYILGALDVEVRNGVARLAEGGSIAGSTLTQDVALRNVVQAGVPLEQAVDALTRTPAELIGRGEDLGRLRQGYAADAVLLDRDLHVRAVWAEGARV